VTRLMTILLCLSLAAVVVSPVCAQGKAVAPVAEKSPAPVAAVDSLPLLEQAVAEDSTRFDDLYALGVLYLDRDKVAEAIKVFTKAHALRPNDHRVSVNLGVALDASGKANQAQVYYREVLAKFPADSVASCRLASSLYSQSKYAEATALLQEIIKKSPRAYCAYFTLGVAFADAGIYKDAIRMWRKVVEIAPTSPEAISARESIDVLEKVVAQ
jgi:tetratricopeptide (TPR) repeat protein